MVKSAVVFLCLISLQVLAQSSPVNGGQPDIHYVCSANPVDCIDSIPTFLDNTPQKSRLWFQYKLYELNSLFLLARYDLLEERLLPWVNADAVPLKFKINTYIFYAKVLRAKNKIELANDYIETAIDELNSISKESADPMLVIQIANAFNEQKKYQQGYDLLIDMERKYRHRDDPVLKVELYGNLGHFTQKLGKLEQHIVYREEVLKWSRRHPDKTRIVVAEYNLARAHQEVTNFEKAIQLFQQARNTALEKGNFYVAEMSIYRQAQIFLKQKNKTEAIRLMKTLDFTHIPESLSKDLIAFKQSLGIKFTAKY